MQIEDIPDNELVWCQEPVIGRVLAIGNFKMIDSFEKPIDVCRKYYVAKHLPTGKLIIIEATLDYKTTELNTNLKMQSRLN